MPGLREAQVSDASQSYFDFWKATEKERNEARAELTERSKALENSRTDWLEAREELAAAKAKGTYVAYKKLQEECELAEVERLNLELGEAQLYHQKCDSLLGEVAALKAERKRLDINAGMYSLEADELRRVAASLAWALELVRGQMCWERDRDQLTMGMTDLHTGVTEALAAWDQVKGGGE